ncbi:ligase-associated DNA damage response endonuclease PdeM [Thermaurantiacus sp.]
MTDSLLLGGHRLVPLACGALYWPAQALLAVADLHLEKGSALARRGWMLPPYDSCDTLVRLQRAIRQTGARVVLALGDSFHDPLGPARLPAQARQMLAELIGAVAWTWIAGNHDGVAAGQLGGAVADDVVVAGIAFRHITDPAAEGPEISGHFHPKTRLLNGHGAARRCFALAGERLLLPAYGSYAGGLDISRPELVAALGQAPLGLLPTARGLVFVDSRTQAA